MSDNVLATAQEAKTTSHEPTEIAESKATATRGSGDMPLEIYARENNKSYIVDALEFGEDVENLPSDMVRSLNFVSDYIEQRIEKEGYEPTTKGFRAMLEKVKSELGIDSNMALETVVERLEGYADSLSLLEQLKALGNKDLLRSIRNAKTKQEMNDIVMEAVEKIGI